MRSVRIFTDGGARGNPGPAGIGVVIQDTESVSRVEYGEYIGVTTNNQAEYRALHWALEHALQTGAREAHCFLDSELVVKQLKREYRVRDRVLGEIFMKVWNLAQHFEKITFTHIPRNKNKQADSLVNKALDEQRTSKIH